MYKFVLDFFQNILYRLTFFRQIKVNQDVQIGTPGKDDGQGSQKGPKERGVWQHD